MLEDNLNLPGNGKLYSKVISWVQRSLWKNGDPLEKLMEEVSIMAFSVSIPFALLMSPKLLFSGWLGVPHPSPAPRVFPLNLVNFAVRAPQNTEKLVFQVSQRLSRFSPFSSYLWTELSLTQRFLPSRAFWTIINFILMAAPPRWSPHVSYRFSNTHQQQICPALKKNARSQPSMVLSQPTKSHLCTLFLRALRLFFQSHCAAIVCLDSSLTRSKVAYNRNDLSLPAISTITVTVDMWKVMAPSRARQHTVVKDLPHSSWLHCFKEQGRTLLCSCFGNTHMVLVGVLLLQVQTLYYSADHKLHDGSLLEGQAEVYSSEDDHIQFVQVQDWFSVLPVQCTAIFAVE